MNDSTPAPAPVLDPAIAAQLSATRAASWPLSCSSTTPAGMLMLGWMDDEALRRTLTEGRVTF